MEKNEPKRSGRFKKGNPGGPGRPKGSYRSALRDEITPEQLAKVVKRLMKAAMSGSVRAAEVIIKLTLGNDPRPLASDAPATLGPGLVLDVGSNPVVIGLSDGPAEVRAKLLSNGIDLSIRPGPREDNVADP